MTKPKKLTLTPAPMPEPPSSEGTYWHRSEKHWPTATKEEKTKGTQVYKPATMPKPPSNSLYKPAPMPKPPSSPKKKKKRKAKKPINYNY